MDFDHLPSNIEQGIQHFASEQHISHDEAVIRLIETGLGKINQKSPIKGLSGVPMTAEEAAIVDEALAIAMEARRARSEKITGA